MRYFLHSVAIFTPKYQIKIFRQPVTPGRYFRCVHPASGYDETCFQIRVHLRTDSRKQHQIFRSRQSQKLSSRAFCWFSGGRSVTKAITVEDWLGVGLAGWADKQPESGGEGGRLGRGGRKRKTKRVGWKWRQMKEKTWSKEGAHRKSGFPSLAAEKLLFSIKVSFLLPLTLSPEAALITAMPKSDSQHCFTHRLLVPIIWDSTPRKWCPKRSETGPFLLSILKFEKMICQLTDMTNMLNLTTARWCLAFVGYPVY